MLSRSTFSLRYFVFLLFIGLSNILSAQDAPVEKEVDLLILELSVVGNDQSRIELLLEIAKIYEGIQCERCVSYAAKALEIANRINYFEGIKESSRLVGESILNCQMNVAKSLPFLNRAMHIAEKQNDSETQLRVLKSLSVAHCFNENYLKSIELNEKALIIAKELNDRKQINSIYEYLANTLFQNNQEKQGIAYYKLILENETVNNFENTLPETYVSIGQYYMILREFEKAENSFLNGIARFEEQRNFRWLSYTYALLTKAQLAQNKVKPAIQSASSGVRVAESNGLNKERLDNYLVLQEAYEKGNDLENSLVFLRKYHFLRDSILNEQQTAERKIVQEEFEFIQKEKERQQGQSVLKSKALKAENDALVFQFALIGLFIFLLILTFVFFRLRHSSAINKRLNAQKHELEKLSIVVANIDQTVLVVNNKDQIEWVNQAFERNFGYEKKEVIHKKPSVILCGKLSDPLIIKEINTKVFIEKVPFETTLIEYNKSGDHFINQLFVTPILSDLGTLERYVVISRDITVERKLTEELEELSLVANNTTNSIVIFNKDIEVVWVNQSFTDLVGLTRAEVIGKTPFELYNSPKISAEERKDILELYRQKKQFTQEIVSTNASTNVRYWLSINITPVFDEFGFLEKYISIATDITAIKELENQYTRLVEESSDLIYEVDISGFFVFVNDVLVRLCGYSKENIKDIYYLKLVRPDYRDLVSDFYQNQITNMVETNYLEFPIVLKDGSELWVGQVSNMIKNESGDKATGFKVISRDITAQRNAEGKLKKAYLNSKLLSEIGMQITSTLSINEIILHVYNNINELMVSNVFGIAFPTKERTALNFPVIIENGVSSHDRVIAFKDQHQPANHSFQFDQEIIIDKDHPYDGQEVGTKDYLASSVFLPLRIKDKVLGIITVQSDSENAFKEYHISLLKSLASFIAIALDNAALYETMEEKVKERTKEVTEQKEELEINYFNTSLLSEIGQLVSSTLDLDEIFDELYQKVNQLMKAEIFGIRIYNESTQIIDYKYTIENGQRSERFEISAENPNNYNVWCIQNKQELIINDNLNEYKQYVDEFPVLRGGTPHSLIFYPMIVENKIIGVITIQSFSKNAYQTYHLDILKTLAAYIGTVIDNVALYETLEDKVKERTEELEQKNLDITASINYAKRLQKGILPSSSFMHQLLPESFVLFKPKDIVSGDFYWMDRSSSKIFFAVVDCTGHGVPGAMMSIIGRNLLDQAVNEKGITVPSQILNFLQVGLSVAFGQNSTGQTELFDGMDLALCTLNLTTMKLNFAGANSSLYLVKDNELITVKGDRFGVTAEYNNFESYNNVEIDIHKGDTIYLSSDGFPDQFGGPNQKKFTYAKFEELISSIQDYTMTDQYEIFNSSLRNWKGDLNQTDDICILGVRV